VIESIAFVFDEYALDHGEERANAGTAVARSKGQKSQGNVPNLRFGTAE
jgi:hypothetical protein